MRVFWDRLVGLQRELEATPWGSLLLGNIWPAYLFALPLGARIWTVSPWLKSSISALKTALLGAFTKKRTSGLAGATKLESLPPNEPTAMPKAAVVDES